MSESCTKTKILQAAGPIFAEKGFRDATVREICAVAEVNLASVNYYFGDKDHLYLETVRFARNTQATRYPFPEWDWGAEPEEKLYGFVHTMLKRIMALQDAPWQVRLVMNEVLNPTDACRHMVDDEFRPVFDNLLGLIDELAPRKLTDDKRIKMGFSVIGQCLFYRYSSQITAMFIKDRRQEEYNVGRLAEHVTQFSLAAIRNTSGEQPPEERIWRAHSETRPEDRIER